MAIINNRELSWLVFNDRVLQEAQDPSVPLMQRLRFLGIFSNNQDEFIKVRVANLIRVAESRERLETQFSGNYSAQELLPLVSRKIEETQAIFTRVYNDIFAQMEHEGVFVINERQLTATQEEFCRNYFSTVISQRMVPLILRAKTAMPFLEDGTIYLAVTMTQSHATRDTNAYAIIRIPTSSACPRFVVLPPSQENRHEIIFIDDIIRLCLDEIFFMFRYDNISAYTFKILRDALLKIDDDVSKSLLEKMEQGIDNRSHGRAVHLIYDREMPPKLLELIASKLGIRNSGHLDASGRYHLLKDLMKFPAVRKDLESQSTPPIYHRFIDQNSSLLKVVRSRDILLCYPYHTFNHVVDFLREAAIDPKVESIYITLYRTAERSKIVNALINAAKNGKRVVALIELMARFDEEQNVENSDMLQRAGVKVIHGMSGLKVHSKIIYVARREGAFTRGYAYVGTGNFNENTARIYGDFAMLTANPKITDEVNQVFEFLLNNHKRFEYNHLWVSPYNMRDQIEKAIDQEIHNAKHGKTAFIHAKFNSLTDISLVKKLYAASKAGVKIKLIVRGACCLAPAVEGISDNIEAISIVDKYLEHARLLIFANDGKEKYHILSADLMTRNLDRRVEVGIPIFDLSLRKLMRKYFDLQWSDNVKARDLKDFGKNSYRHRSADTPAKRSQIELFKLFGQ